MELSPWAPDGTCIQSTAAGEGQDEDGDKATSKAMSAAMKYALLFTFLIPANQGGREGNGK